jgi:hypothetical protein
VGRIDRGGGETQTMNEQTKSTYEKALDDLAEKRKKIDDLKPHLERLESLIPVFPDIALYVNYGIDVNSVQGALLYVNELDDMREVVPVLKAVRALGYKSKGFEDYPELKRRKFDCGDVQVLAFLKWEGGTKCEFKQTGTKQQPVYELVCDGEKVEIEA